jgi:hypothetical protein
VYLSPKLVAHTQRALCVAGHARPHTRERRAGSSDPRPADMRGLVVERCTAHTETLRYLLAQHRGRDDFSVRVQNFGPHPLEQGARPPPPPPHMCVVSCAARAHSSTARPGTTLSVTFSTQRRHTRPCVFVRR